MPALGLMVGWFPLLISWSVLVMVSVTMRRLSARPDVVSCFLQSPISGLLSVKTAMSQEPANVRIPTLAPLVANSFVQQTRGECATVTATVAFRMVKVDREGVSVFGHTGVTPVRACIVPDPRQQGILREELVSRM